MWCDEPDQKALALAVRVRLSGRYQNSQRDPSPNGSQHDRETCVVTSVGGCEH